MPETDHRPVVAIIGGGFSGTAVAFHLANAGVAADIVVFEPRETLGAGLAYGTTEPSHRINVPADKMSLNPEDPEGFLRYVTARDVQAEDPAAVHVSGQIFPQRSVFGAYVASEISPHLASGRVSHRRVRVASVRRLHSGWQVTDDSGQTLTADILVLAATHPAPDLPRALNAIRDHAGLIAGGAQSDLAARVAKDDRVLVIGLGLTAADAIATLDRIGHRGPVLAISRRGLRSRGHAEVVQEPWGDFVTTTNRRASALVRQTRRALREAAAGGITWHAVLDALRLQGQDIWRALPVAGRRRLARHVRPWWDAHRFRIAPQVEAALDRAISEGRLTLRAARLQSVQAEGGAIHVALRDRGATLSDHVFDRVIVTTGPAHARILDSQPFLRALRDSGHIRLCETGLGISCDPRSRAISAGAGGTNDTLFISGPLARGTFGELMGLPQVSEHAVSVAKEVESLLAHARHAHNLPQQRPISISSQPQEIQ